MAHSVCVVVWDEAGMTDDRDFLRLVGRIEQARAGLVMVGDDGQANGPVGPASRRRSPGWNAALPMLQHLDKDRRRGRHRGARCARTAARRQCWRRGRLVPHRAAGSTRRPIGTGRCGGPLKAGPLGWKPVVTPAIFAYRRSNVAEFDPKMAREVMVEQGRVGGPEVHGMAVSGPGESSGPIPDVQMVNSQRATVIAVNQAWQIIDLRADDGHLLPGIQGDKDSTVLPSPMPPPFTARKAPLSTPDMCWPTAAAGSWRAWRCPGPSRPPSGSSPQRTTQPWPSRNSRPTEQHERHYRWAIDTGLPPTTEAQQLEQDLDQRQRANVLAIAAHEKTGHGSERTRAAIAVELDRYRAGDGGPAAGIQLPWPEPRSMYPSPIWSVAWTSQSRGLWQHFLPQSLTVRPASVRRFERESAYSSWATDGQVVNCAPVNTDCSENLLSLPSRQSGQLTQSLRSW